MLASSLLAMHVNDDDSAPPSPETSTSTSVSMECTIDMLRAGNYDAGLNSVDSLLLKCKNHNLQWRRHHDLSVGRLFALRGTILGKMGRWEEANGAFKCALQCDDTRFGGGARSRIAKIDKMIARCNAGIAKEANEASQSRRDHPNHDSDKDDESPALIKFPRTAHLVDMSVYTQTLSKASTKVASPISSAVTDDDIVIDRKLLDNRLSSHTLIIEEKIDGANMGITMQKDGRLVCQNRSHYINSRTHSQFSTLDRWLETHHSTLAALLRPDRDILYGEWCGAKHSLHYSKLPDVFLAFDLYDRWTERFAPREEMDERLAIANGMRSSLSSYNDDFHASDSTIFAVPVMAYGRVASLDELACLLNRASAFTTQTGFVEGIYVRLEEQDEDDENEPSKEHRTRPCKCFVRQQSADVAARSNSQRMPERCKLVRSDFTQNITTHWSKKTMVKNIVDSEMTQSYARASLNALSRLKEVNKEASSFLLQRQHQEQSSEKKRQSVPQHLWLSSSLPYPAYDLDRQVNMDNSQNSNNTIPLPGGCLPRCLMLIGIPGSGKSTLAKHIVKHATLNNDEDDNVGSRKWVRVNQDSQGRETCMDILKNIMRRPYDGTHVVIDRCNIDSRQRKNLFRTMGRETRPSDVWALHLDIPVHDCLRRVNSRKNHETIPHGSNDASRIVKSFAKTFVSCDTESEGIERSITVQTPQQLDDLLVSWGLPPIEVDTN